MRSAGPPPKHLAETLAVFTDGEVEQTPLTPLTTAEVTAALDCTRRTAYNRLERLVERGDLQTKKVGARGRIWWCVPPESIATEPSTAETDGRELGYFDSLDEVLHDGGFVLDEEGRFLEVTDAYADLTGYSKTALVGAHYSNVTDRDCSESVMTLVQQVSRNGEGDGDDCPSKFVTDVVRADGVRLPVAGRFALLDRDGTPDRVVGVVRDLTDRLRRERSLDESERRSQTLIDNFPNGAVAMFDRELRYTLIGGAVFDDVGTEPSRLLGTKAGELVMEGDVQRQFAEHYRAALEGETRQFEFEWNERQFHQWVLPLFDSDHNVFGGMAMSQEITESRRRERELERYKTIIETLWDGVYALDPDERFVFVNDAYLELVGRERAELLDRPAATIREAISEPLGFDEDLAIGNWSESTMELELADDDGERRYLEARFGPYRYDDERYARTGVVRDITSRRRYEQRLEAQNTRLTALKNFNEVVDELVHTLLESSTRSGLEQLVCEQLSSSDAYSCAWVGSVEWADQTIRVRTQAGDSALVPTEPIQFADDGDDTNPIAAAIRTQTVHVGTESSRHLHHVSDAVEHAAVESTSMAAIPVTYENSVYGVLVLCSSRPEAFEGDERRIVTRLGDVIGHALASLDRKRALVNDDVLVLEIGIADVFGRLDIDGTDDARVTFDRLIPIGDGNYLEYGSVSTESVELLSEIVDELPHFERLRIVAETGSVSRFELLLTHPPATEVIASHGGYVREALIENGDYRMIVELPHGAAVRSVLDALHEAYPGVELVAQRHSKSQPNEQGRLRITVSERLTDRQRAVLEAAYFGGFFEWPRDCTGEELAEAIGIAPPTLHKHLRAAENKLLRTLFERQSTLSRR